MIKRGCTKISELVCPMLLLVIILDVATFAPPVSAASAVEIMIDQSKTVGTNQLSLGFVLHWDFPAFLNNSTLRTLAKNMYPRMVRFYSPRVEPCTSWSESIKTGTFNWATVDLLVQRILEIGATPLICLGYCNPDGSLQIPLGMAKNPNTRLPYPASYAAYCAAWVKHFKSTGKNVIYYQIVNEPFVYYGWDRSETELIGNFAKLFNAAIKSMRAANPSVRVGSDVGLQKKFLDYFVVNGELLDFLSFHKYALGESGGTDAYALSQAKNQYFLQGTLNWYSVDEARQIYYNKRGKTLPVFISEHNLNYAYQNGTDPRNQQMVGAVYTALVLKQSVLKGISNCMYYQLSSNASSFGMIDSTANRPCYPYYVEKMVGSNLAVGDRIVSITSSSSQVSALAWIHNGKLCLLLTCEVTEQRITHFHGITGRLNYTKIDNTYSWKTPRVQTGTIDSTTSLSLNGYTVILLQT